LQPRGSIKAPSSVVRVGYVAAEERIGLRDAASVTMDTSAAREP
jgi:hypothetical protein